MEFDDIKLSKISDGDYRDEECNDYSFIALARQLIEARKRIAELKAIVERVNIEALDESEGAMDMAMKRIEELEKQLANAITNKFTYCAYCSQVFPIEDPETPRLVAIHIATCPKHPMRIPEKRIAELEAELAAANRDAERLYQAFKENCPKDSMVEACLLHVARLDGK